MRARKLIRLAVAMAVGVVLVAPFTEATAAVCDVPGRVQESRGWRTITPPPFLTGPQEIAAFDVVPAVPYAAFITNGKEVQRSVDQGCHWQVVYTMKEAASAEQPFSGTNATIVAIETAPSGAGGTVLLLVREEAGPVQRPHVLTSHDAGRSWQSGDTGLPPSGRPDFLRAAPTVPSLFYLGVDLGGGGIELLFASTDAGDSWQLRSDLARTQPNTQLEGLAVDPMVADELWAWGHNGVYHSTDGGRSFQKPQELVDETESGPGDVFHASPDPSRIWVYIPTPAPKMIRSDDGGQKWFDHPAPGPVDSIATAFEANFTFVTAAGRAYVYHSPTDQWLDTAARQGITGLISVADTIIGRTPKTLEVFIGGGDAPPPPGGVKRPWVSLDPVQNPPQPGRYRMTPQRQKVVIQPEGSRKVSYLLHTPKKQRPLDVYLLVDTSGSMRGVLEVMKQTLAGMIEDLGRERISVHFGMAEYRSYPDQNPPRPSCEDTPALQDCERNYVYKQLLDIQPPGDALEEALNSLNANGGGHYDSQLTALYQSATGEGQDLYPPGQVGHDVEAGHEATFRDEAYKVIFHVADESFKTTDDDYEPRDPTALPEPPDIPPYKDVIAALNGKGIDQVGLSIGNDATPGLTKVASGTGAVAPPGGADCDGDGAVDIAEGDPMVCQFERSRILEATNLADAIVRMLRSAISQASLGLQVAAGDDVVGDIAPAVYEGVLLQKPRELPFEVEYRCPLRLAGERKTVRLEAVDRDGKVLTRATTSVVCRDVIKKDRPSAFQGLVPLAPRAAPPPPPLTFTSTVSQSQTQAQSQAQAQSAAAMQEEEQPQMAFVDAFDAFEEQMGEEYAFASYERRRAPVSPELVLGAGTAVMLFAFGCVAAVRNRLTPARARGRR